MNFAAIPWAKLHGAATHFPIVLSVVAFACDALAAWRWSRPEAQGLRQAGLGAIVLAAAGGVGAVVSGLVLARGELWGDGALGRHHRFVWPAFALVTGAAAWRWAAAGQLTRGRLAAYAVTVLATAGLIAASAYYGGEMLLGQP